MQNQHASGTPVLHPHGEKRANFLGMTRKASGQGEAVLGKANPLYLDRGDELCGECRLRGFVANPLYAAVVGQFEF
jgi:hypothetical protein